ncbi:MAG: carbohydrate kinase [Clostridia bacterium]|nr:carbohydrate kinase [Clostridia bacterium]
MTTRYHAAALGEYLIDFTDNGLSPQGNTLFEANPGGAPCNVLSMLNRLGRRCAFIGKVGDDMFGSLLRRTGEEAGICMDGLAVDPCVRTTLAFVQTLPGGDRDFSFYRNPGADMQLTEGDLPAEILQNTAVFHYGSISMTHEPARSATVRALETAGNAGALISYDPNLRPPLWDTLPEAREQIDWGLDHCDICKIADNELEFMTGLTLERGEDFDRGAAILLEKHPTIRLLNVTAGAGGSYGYTGGLRVYQPAFLLGGTIETTGAGDAFCGCVLDYILDHGLAFTEETLSEMLRYASAAAYLVTTRKGAVRSMPTPEQIAEILEK